MGYAGTSMPGSDLTSAYFLNARALSAASTFVNSEVANRRATLEVTLTHLPTHWGFLVCAGVPVLTHTLERINPSASEVESALRIGCITTDLAKRMTSTPCSIDANVPPEGSLVFCGDPIATIEGPLWQAWIVAEVARTILVSNSCVATRAARLTLGAKGVPLIDASSCTRSGRVRVLSIAQAAYVGGASFTQRPLASASLGIPLRSSPPSAALALTGPAEVNRASGWSFSSSSHDVLVGLGPGYDEEETLAEMQSAGMLAGGWMSRGRDHPAEGLELRIDLVALEHGGAWTPRLGAVPDFACNPGRKIVIRYCDGAARPIADIIHGLGERIQPAEQAELVGYQNSGVAVPIDGARSAQPVHVSVVRNGSRSGPDEDLPTVRERARVALLALHESYKRLRHPATFPVGIAPSLAQLKASLVLGAC